MDTKSNQNIFRKLIRILPFFSQKKLKDSKHFYDLIITNYTNLLYIFSLMFSVITTIYFQINLLYNKIPDDANNESKRFQLFLILTILNSAIFIIFIILIFTKRRICKKILVALFYICYEGFIIGSFFLIKDLDSQFQSVVLGQIQEKSLENFYLEFFFVSSFIFIAFEVRIFNKGCCYKRNLIVYYFIYKTTLFFLIINYFKQKCSALEFNFQIFVYLCILIISLFRYFVLIEKNALLKEFFLEKNYLCEYYKGLMNMLNKSFLSFNITTNHITCNLSFVNLAKKLGLKDQEIETNLFSDQDENFSLFKKFKKKKEKKSKSKIRIKPPNEAKNEISVVKKTNNLRSFLNINSNLENSRSKYNEIMNNGSSNNSLSKRQVSFISNKENLLKAIKNSPNNIPRSEKYEMGDLNNKNRNKPSSGMLSSNLDNQNHVGDKIALNSEALFLNLSDCSNYKDNHSLNGSLNNKLPRNNSHSQKESRSSRSKNCKSDIHEFSPPHSDENKQVDKEPEEYESDREEVQEEIFLRKLDFVLKDIFDLFDENNNNNNSEILKNLNNDEPRQLSLFIREIFYSSKKMKINENFVYKGIFTYNPEKNRRECKVDKLILELYFRKILSYKGEIVEFYFNDVTNLMLKVEREKEQNKIRSLILAKISHEFKTPLITIIYILKNYLEKTNTEKPDIIHQYQEQHYPMDHKTSIINNNSIINYNNLNINNINNVNIINQHRFTQSQNLNLKESSMLLSSNINVLSKNFNQTIFSTTDMSSNKNYSNQAATGIIDNVLANQQSESKHPNSSRVINNELDGNLNNISETQNMNMILNNINSGKSFANNISNNKANIPKNQLISYSNSAINPKNLSASTSFGQKRFSKSSSIDGSDNYLKNTIDLSDYMLTLINDIIDFSVIDSKFDFKCNFQDFDLYSVLNFCFRILKILINCKGLGKYIKPVLEIDENVPQMICSDEMRLKQVLLNLISNSIKFTRRGYIKLTARADEANYVVISIEDTGIGISKDDLEKLFKDYGKLKNEESSKMNAIGSGLGLSICKKIIKKIGKEINVQSIQNVRTIFYFNLANKNFRTLNRSYSSVEFRDCQVGSLFSKFTKINDDYLINEKNVQNVQVQKRKNKLKVKDEIIFENKPPLKNRIKKRWNSLNIKKFPLNSKKLNNPSESIEKTTVTNITPKFIPPPINMTILSTKSLDLTIQETPRTLSDLDIIDVFNKIKSTEKPSEIFMRKTFAEGMLNINRLDLADKSYHNDLSGKSRLLGMNEEMLKFCKPIRKYLKHKNKNIILVIDDNEIIRSSIKKLIENLFDKENFATICLSDGIEILYMVMLDQNIENSIRVIISDEQMIFMNGTEANKILLNMQKDKRINYIPFVYCSSNREEEAFLKSNQIKFVLPKPPSKKEIMVLFENLELCEKNQQKIFS